MGVISDHIEERDAQAGPDSETTTDAEPADSADDGAALPESADPFLQRYQTERFDADAEAIDQMLTGLIAVGNLL